jgi:hypothetical protein
MNGITLALNQPLHLTAFAGSEYNLSLCLEVIGPRNMQKMLGQHANATKA